MYYPYSRYVKGYHLLSKLYKGAIVSLKSAIEKKSLDLWVEPPGIQIFLINPQGVAACFLTVLVSKKA